MLESSCWLDSAARNDYPDKAVTLARMTRAVYAISLPYAIPLRASECLLGRASISRS